MGIKSSCMFFLSMLGSVLQALGVKTGHQKMGNGNRHRPFVRMFKNMIRARGVKVGHQQLCEFLELIEKVCPWFPEEGTVNLGTWKEVGDTLRDYYDIVESGKMPLDIFGLWILIRDCLDSRHERDEIRGQTLDSSMVERKGPGYAGDAPAVWEDRETRPSAPPLEPERPFGMFSGNEGDYPPFIASLEEEIQRLQSALSSLMVQMQQLRARAKPPELSERVSRSGPKRAPSVVGIDPPSFEEPQPVSARVQRPPGPRPLSSVGPPLSPLQAILQQAAERGEDTQEFHLTYPVFEDVDAQGQRVRSHRPVSFEQLKELKLACTQYGPTAPFTQAVLESLCTASLPPGDWKQLARACLSGGDFLLWKSEFAEQCQNTADLNKRQNIPTTFEMLAGEGQYQEIAQQLNFDPGVYAQVNAAAKRAWCKLPSTGRQTEDLSRIRQGPDEPFQDFVARLMQTASRLLGDSDAAMLLVKQLAYENANTACQAALRPFRNKSTISDYIRLCSDIGPAYTQGLAMAAALQGKTVKEMLFQQRKPAKGRAPGPPGNCYGCGRPGHRVRQCPDRYKPAPQGPPRWGRQPGLCPKCKRGNHWANECRSRGNNMGNPFPQGNGRRGPPRAPQQCYGAMQTFVPQEGNPFRTSSEQPQAAQDWTSVPPPTQY